MEKLRVFEAFSGMGAQHMAFRNTGKEFEIVATSEVDINAILAYYYINCKNKKIEEEKTTEQKRDYLNKIGIANKSRIDNLEEEQLDEIYNACIVSKNLGDIKKIKKEDVPDHDIFTYSFPCQDISSVGTKKGLDEQSGTRSSLLWECKKIIEYKKPKYLVLENVKNLTTGKNRKNFDEWLSFLESQGYSNYWDILDAKDYGIPQRRPRTIVVSKLGEARTDLLARNKFEEKTIDELLDKNNNNLIEFTPKAEVYGDVEEGKYAFLDDRDWKFNGVMIGNLCSTQRAGRTGLKCIVRNNNILYERKLTALECCRLMGFDDKDYYNMKTGNITDGIIMKLCGNSIVVNVLENVFLNIYKEEEQ